MKLVAELHPDNPHPRAEHAFEMFVLRSEDFDVGDLLKGELGIEIDCAIGIAHRHSDGLHGEFRRREPRRAEEMHRRQAPRQDST